MVTKVVTGPPVLLNEVAARCGTDEAKVVMRAHDLGVKPEADWAGRLTVPPAVAAELVEKIRAEELAWSQKHFEYQGYIKQHDHDSQAAWREAYEKAAAEALKEQISYAQRLHDEGLPGDETGQGWAPGGYPVSSRPDPRVEDHARQIAHDARQAWDKRNPLLDFTEWAKKR
jgi:hypothetical protein